MNSEPNIGFRIRTTIHRTDPEVVKAFEGLPIGNICDANGRLGAMHYLIKPLNPRWHFVGTAFTVRARPVDNLLLHKALELVQPGDVLVITNDSSTATSVFGDLVVSIAKAKGVAALVTDGVARDAAGILEVDLPVFVRGINANGPYKDGPGEINFPISCGGIPVHPGDVVAGDGDGVVVVRREDAPFVAENLQKIIEKERQTAERIAAGQYTPDWIDKVLVEKGIQIIES
jgi:regulator of RNase E activity RraA